LVAFTHTTPALSWGATSSARFTFSVHTLAASPYDVLFASATASDGVRKVMDTSTGPKISTCATLDDGATSVKSVGG
jgi:WD40 repeat protein